MRSRPQSTKMKRTMALPKSAVPGAEPGRLPPTWVKYFMFSSIFCGYGSAYAAWSAGWLIYSALLTFIATTSLNYWRKPEPGIRLKMDVTAIAICMCTNYCLVIMHPRSCTLLAAMYISSHWLFIVLSMVAYNYLPEKPGLLLWTNKDWSALLWLFVHYACLVMNCTVFAQLKGAIDVCGE